MFGISFGAVSCAFKKEIRPYEPYEMWTRVLSWDQKWIYVVTYFVRKGAVIPRRYTLHPQQMSDKESRSSSRIGNENFSGEDTKKDLQDNLYGTALSRCVFKQGRKTISPESMMRISGLLPEEFGGIMGDKETCGRLASIPEEVVGEHVGNDWTSARVEEERKRGLEIARQLALSSQQELENAFTGDSEALGVHTDGAGIVGAVSTLAQLTGLKKDQIL
ncbi:MAG: hypothetical protein M1818_000597 [Claussenomyces sp. TS43310]|nr:MAG: hypothetical protein M1818_000597 [Claussenomyces sp. TS43310]